MARKNKGPTLMQKRFVDELFVDYNQTAAAIRAGYSPRSAHSIASELRDNPDIQEMIELREAQISARTGSSVERIKRELASIAFVNPKNFIETTDHGEITIKNMEDIDDIDAAAIQEITVTRGRSGTTTKLKLIDKKGPLELLGKTEGMFKDKIEVEFKGGVAERLKRAKERKESGADE